MVAELDYTEKSLLESLLKEAFSKKLAGASHSPKNCLFIAEAGVNHNGNMAKAHELIEVAADAGAHVVKFQLFSPEALTVKQAPMATYQKEALQNNALKENSSNSQQKMLQKLALKPEQMKTLKHYADKQGILFLCTPFDPASAEFLINELKLPVLKLSSGDLTYWPMMKTLAQQQIPLLLSTGMASLQEVKAVLDNLKPLYQSPLAKNIGLFHCVSAYPAPTEAINLRAIETMAKAFNPIAVGYSDHTLGLEVPLAAVALGARLIEKHFTLDKTLEGPDHKASLEPEELKALVAGIITIEDALGNGIKAPHPCEADVMQVGRRSIVATQNLPSGHKLCEADLTCKRPATGISPLAWEATLGQRLRQPILADTPLEPSHLTPG